MAINDSQIRRNNEVGQSNRSSLRMETSCFIKPPGFSVASSPNTPAITLLASLPRCFIDEPFDFRSGLVCGQICLSCRPHVELQPPAVVSLFRLTPQIDRPNFAQVGIQGNRNRSSLIASIGPQYRTNRRQWLHLLSVDRDDFARLVSQSGTRHI